MADLDSLRNILQLECRKGYSDKAVIGGLDKYLHRQAGLFRQSVNDPELLASFDKLKLADSSYSSYSLEERREWIASILEWLDRWEKARRENVCDVTMPRKLSAAPPKPCLPAAGDIDSPLTVLKGISSKTASRFAKLNVRTVRDLLYFFPKRYVDYSRIKPVCQLVEGEEQTIIGTVWQAKVTTLGNRPGTEAIIGDATGNVRAVWFNQPYIAKDLPTNAVVVISGAVGLFRGQRVFESPEWELLKDKELIHTGRLVPVYPLTQGLYPRQVRKWVKEAVDGYAGRLEDFLPQDIKTRCQLLDLPVAIKEVHYPSDFATLEKARKRLAFDELFLLQLGLLAKKRDWQESQPGNAFCIDQELVEKFLRSLPFSLTRAQERAFEEILADLKQSKPMSRLLQGDVGSGKTVIAALALLIAVSNRYQGALMAPTEVLAEQHYHTMCGYFSRCGMDKSSLLSKGEENVKYYEGIISRPFSIALLTGSLKSSVRERLHAMINKGEIDLVVGTHTLIQKEIQFSRLGLAVIDEQHRFGVLQRASLRQKGFNPHVLAMTATPIPRTMALTLYGDLDISIIDELPPGRKPVQTRLLDPRHREKAYRFVRNEISNGQQAFVIYPLIEESGMLEARAATAEYERLSREVFPDLRLALLHGQMPSQEKERVMRRFRAGEVDILVSTSVVEVGIDVPRASVILVEGAERFGLSQLHQLRGRVGRDKQQGYCILIPQTLSPEAIARLRLLEKIHDGFTLAEKDLELRGPGEFFGTHQTGLPNLRLARLSDVHSLELARREAINLFQRDAGLARPEHQLLRRQLSQLWCQEAEWS